MAKAASPISGVEISSVRVHDLEGRGLSEEQRDELTRMRAASTGDEAYAVGADLPTGARLYTAAAVDFLRAHPLIPYSEDGAEPAGQQSGVGNGASQQAALTAAIARFRAVTTLPAREAAGRRLWAEYMLGRAYRLRGLPGDLERSARHFERVIALVKRGSDLTSATLPSAS